MPRIFRSCGILYIYQVKNKILNDLSYSAFLLFFTVSRTVIRNKISYCHKVPHIKVHTHLSNVVMPGLTIWLTSQFNITEKSNEKTYFYFRIAFIIDQVEYR